MKVGIDRRAVLKAGLATSGALGFGRIAHALPVADVAIHDSRFAARAGPADRTLDLVDERRTHWATIRNGLANSRRIEGVTTWSDYVMIAHELERRGFRRAAEVKVGRLWRWKLLRQDQRIERDHTLP